MKVSELEVGEIYKIRSDRKTYVNVDYKLDIHVGNGHGRTNGKIRPFDYIVYLGFDHRGDRKVRYRGKEMAIYPNAWMHIRHIDDDIS